MAILKYKKLNEDGSYSWEQISGNMKNLEDGEHEGSIQGSFKSIIPAWNATKINYSSKSQYYDELYIMYNDNCYKAIAEDIPAGTLPTDTNYWQLVEVPVIKNKADKKGAIAFGNNSIASGKYSAAVGNQVNAAGEASHAEGRRTMAIGNNSHVEGGSTKAMGASSHAEGSYNTAYARQSHVEGYKTVAGTEEAYEIDNSSDNGIGSGVIACHAEGDNTVASGSKSHAEGSYSRATGRVSHAEGGITEASGYYAHSENYKTRANGIGSHAEGYATEANAKYSHAEGHSSKAYGRYSYAGGLATISTGAHSHVRGTRNIADTELQSRYLGSLKCSLNNLKTFPLSANETYNTNDVVLYNNVYWRYKLGNDTTTNIIPGEDSTVWADISDYRGKYLEIVGNGVDGSPSNAYTLDWDGNAWFAGNIKLGGINQNDTDAAIVLTSKNISDFLQNANTITYSSEATTEEN